MKKLLLIIISFGLIFTGCTKTPQGNMGNLKIKVTDDPFKINIVESATVTINKIELRKAGTNDDNENKFIVLSEEPVTFDLFKLRNGVTEEMINLSIPEGNFDMIRLFVSEAGLKIKDQTNNFRLKIPGGSQTGIKIFISPGLRVAGGLTSELLLDFDLSRSFVMQGNLNNGNKVHGFIFKPVIRAANISNSGRLEGIVSNELNELLTDAEVWIKNDTARISTSFTDTTGKYVMIGIPAGAYSLYAYKPDFDTTILNNINIVEGNRTVKDVVLKK